MSEMKIKGIPKRGGMALFLLLFLLSLVCFIPVVNPAVHTLSAAPVREDIAPLLAKEELKPEDYEILFLQTGLSKTAVDLLRDTGRANQILVYQDHFQQTLWYSESMLGLVTIQERLCDETGNRTSHPEFADLRDGDILVAFGTRTFGWRHGHAALVVDAEEEISLEAYVLGQDSAYQSARHFRSYPGVIQLRVKSGEEKVRQAVAFANEKLVGVPYGLFSGIWPFNNPDGALFTTQCADLVQQAYAGAGIFLDDGLIKTPAGLLQSSQVEVVQVMGINPMEIVRQKG